MTRKLSEDETLKLVQLYGENECLWDIKSLNYRNEEMRSTALQNMAQQMQIGGLTSTEVKNKIKAIRATYYLELDKIQKSTRSGAGGNVYVPKVKWFQELDGFIKNAIVKRKTMDNSGTSNDDVELGEAEGVGDGAENV
ncbi:unnamed protein product [Parnassius mnemosyne]|uniref:MADF domain-containing protein n=1 Tax=Parnassius mnemosyne TaxID=213953 RepID=A0AAV1LAN0_9NEOP